MVGTIVTSILNSKRLPRKAMLLVNGLSLIRRCLLQCTAITKSQKTILATSWDSCDTPLYDSIGGSVNWDRFRGETNPILRMLQCSKHFGVNTIVRVTGDSPLICPRLADLLIESHIKQKADFTYAEDMPTGVKSEIIAVSALKQIADNFNMEYGEYISLFFKNNPDIFHLNKVNIPAKWMADYRVTVDYPEDYVVVSQIIEYCRDLTFVITIPDVKEVFCMNPWLNTINKDIKQIFNDIPIENFKPNRN